MCRALILAALAGAVPASAQSPLATYLDSAALHAALVEQAPPRADGVLGQTFAVTFDSSGAPSRVRAVAAALMEDDYEARIAPLVLRSLRPLPPAPRGYYVTLRAAAGPAPVIGLERLVQVPPRLLNTGVVQRGLEQVARTLAARDRTLEGTTMTVRVRARITRGGTADSLRVVTAGRPELDEAALRMAGLGRYSPATLNGVPIAVDVVLPIRFVFPAPARPRS